MTKSKSRAEDDERAKGSQSRMGETHGGEVVEAIAPEELVTVNDAECKHDNLTRDESETDFVAFTCDNPACGVVVLYKQ